MIAVIAAVNDEKILQANLLRSPMMTRPDVSFSAQRGFASASAAFRAAMSACTADVMVFVHQDVYLPGGWELRLRGAIARLDAVDPDWAVLGVYGVTAEGRQVGCVWSSGLETLFGAEFDDPVRVDSIDEVLIVLRRSSGVQFDPDLPGYHLYATDLVQTALSRGLHAYSICAPIVHNSRPAPYLGADYFRAYRYMTRKWRHRLPIANNVAPLLKPGLSYLALRARHKYVELKLSPSRRARVDRGFDCVDIARRLELE